MREIFAALRAAWWLPAAGLVVGAVAALVGSLAQTPLYAAQTQMFVSTRDSATTSEAFQGSQFSEQRVTSYARLLAGEGIAKRVIESLDLDMSPGDLISATEASAVSDTVLLEVSVTDPSPQRAAAIARAVGEEFPQLVSELETPEEGSSSPVKVTVTDAPEVPAAPTSPSTQRNIILGSAVGLLVGAALAILRRRLDRSVKEPAVARQLTGAPVIGTVLRDSALEKAHIIVRNTASRTAEDYRQLRTNLQFLNVDEPPRVIMVSSAMPAEGKTTVVVNLALALADAGRSVVIVEADLRRPKVTKYLGMVGGVGLTNVLARTADLAEVTQLYGDGELAVVAAGPTPPNPGELLTSDHMHTLLDDLRGAYDYVLVDAPPLLPVADASGLSVLVDGVLLSVRYGSTTRDQLQQAAATLEGVGAKTLGLILNIVPPKAELASAYGYGYSYESTNPHDGEKKRKA